MPLDARAGRRRAGLEVGRGVRDVGRGRLGFTKTVDVPGPDGSSLGFALLVSGAVELMLQTRASVAPDVPALANEPLRSTLDLEVEHLDPIRQAVAGLDVVVPERTSFYGARELGVREPGGPFVTFAAPATPPAEPRSRASS